MNKIFKEIVIKNLETNKNKYIINYLKLIISILKTLN